MLNYNKKEIRIITYCIVFCTDGFFLNNNNMRPTFLSTSCISIHIW